MCAPSHSHRRVSKLAEVKGELPAAAAAPALAGAAAPAAATPDLLPGTTEYLEENLSVRELRARLLARGLSTLGLKAELRERLEKSLFSDRQMFKSWDPVALAWK